MSAAGPERRRERVTTLIELFNEDHERWLTALPEDIVVVTDPAWPGGGSFAGRAQLAVFMHQFEEAWESVVFDLGEFEERGDALVSGARWVTRGSASGVETDMSFSVVWLFREDDELREARFFFDENDAWEYAASQG